MTDGARVDYRNRTTGLLACAALIAAFPAARAVPAAAQDALLSTAVGICENALKRGNPDVSASAETFGFQSTRMSNGSPAWVHQEGSDRTLVYSGTGTCGIGLNRGNYTSGATKAFLSWAQSASISFSAVPAGGQYGEKNGFTYRYTEIPQNGMGSLLIQPQRSR